MQVANEGCRRDLAQLASEFSKGVGLSYKYLNGSYHGLRDIL